MLRCLCAIRREQTLSTSVAVHSKVHTVSHSKMKAVRQSIGRWIWETKKRKRERERIEERKRSSGWQTSSIRKTWALGYVSLHSRWPVLMIEAKYIEFIPWTYRPADVFVFGPFEEANFNLVDFRPRHSLPLTALIDSKTDFLCVNTYTYIYIAWVDHYGKYIVCFWQWIFTICKRICRSAILFIVYIYKKDHFLQEESRKNCMGKK